MSNQANPAVFQLDVLTMGKVIFSGPVRYADIPGLAGHLGVLRDHTPTIALLAPGVLRYQLPDGSTAEMPVLGGFAEVGPHGVRVLADHAGRDAQNEQRRMAQARDRAHRARAAHTGRPSTPEAAKAQVDADLLRFFASAVKARR